MPTMTGTKPARKPADPTMVAVPWPAGPRLMLWLPDHDVAFPGLCVGFPRLGIVGMALDGDLPVVPRDADAPWEEWLAACARSVEEMRHTLVRNACTDAERHFLGRWSTSLRDNARYRCPRRFGIVTHFMGMGHCAYDAGPYSGGHRWPGEGKTA